MSKIITTYTQLVQDSQEYGSDDEHMVSRATFDLEFDGEVYSNCTIDIKQTVGSDYNNGPLEISNLQGYEGPNDWSKLQYNTEILYRSLIGSQGSCINFSCGSSNIRMLNNTFDIKRTFQYEVENNSELSGGW
ncbi:hypothetical protein [Litoribacillus peritrichatus]|uniref:Uncharacterized protein n=1 Tax=Litoribacillus peritrichatus TaxID=718191 RepID=A0ABP7N612_9GAMM